MIVLREATVGTSYFFVRSDTYFIITAIVINQERGERIPLTIADADVESGTITLVVQAIGDSTRAPGLRDLAIIGASTTNLATPDEKYSFETPSQKSLADYLVSLGVDMIIGGHPHVVQPMETLNPPTSTMAGTKVSLATES